MLPLVSVIILGYNSKKFLRWCVGAVLSQSYPNLEIIYVDNGSTDHSIDFVKENYEREIDKIIDNKKNLGYARGQNVGIKNSSGEYVLCLNPDIILEKDYIKNIIDLFRKNPRIGAVTGKLLKFKIISIGHSEADGYRPKDPPGAYGDPSSVLPPQDDIIEKTNIIDSCGLQIFKSHRVIERGGGEIKSQISNLKSQIYDKPKEVFGVSGAAPIFKKEALEKIKFHGQYFDEDFFSYKEDVDLSFRMRHAGYDIWFEPKSQAYHHRWETGTKKKESNQEIISRRQKRPPLINYLSYRNHLYVLFKNVFLTNIVFSFPWIFFYEIKKLFFALFFERSNLRALFDFISNLSLTLTKRRDILSKSKIKSEKMRKWLK